MIERPWGSFRIISQTKIISITPNKRTSKQYHNNRTERWTIIGGDGFVEIGGKRTEVRIGDSFIVNRKMKHRIGGGKYGMEILEISEGGVEEEDIVRIEDDFGRC